MKIGELWEWNGKIFSSKLKETEVSIVDFDDDSIVFNGSNKKIPNYRWSRMEFFDTYNKVYE